MINLSAMTAEERTYRFSNTFAQKQGKTAQAIAAIQEALAAGCGLITLTGPYGVGKSRLLIATVNESIELGVPGIYTRLQDLLDFLRESFSRKKEEDYGYMQRLEDLKSVPILAIDELDKVNETGWVREQLAGIIDYRYRRMSTDQVTILATNAPIDSLEGSIRSRLRDGKATIIQFPAGDFRPHRKKGAPQK